VEEETAGEEEGDVKDEGETAEVGVAGTEYAGAVVVTEPRGDVVAKRALVEDKVVHEEGKETSLSETESTFRVDSACMTQLDVEAVELEGGVGDCTRERDKGRKEIEEKGANLGGQGHRTRDSDLEYRR
jgi:hypothetical protein